MSARLQNLWEQLRANFWFVPTLMTAGALLLAFAMINLDQAVRETAISQLGWTYTRGPEGARALLSTVAGSVITVASVTFSITITALTLASSQFGPRLLRSFLRDSGNQIVLGTFIATFLYCLLVLRTVHGSGDDAFVPNIAVAVGVGLAIASLGVLIYFINHVSVAIQVEHVIAAVGRDLDEVIDHMFPEPLGQAEAEAPHDREPLTGREEALPVLANGFGYVQAIDTDGVLRIATEHDLVIELLRQPGDVVLRGLSLACAWPQERVDEQLAQEIASVYILGEQRTLTQDVLCAVDQLVEIAVRALSPGINDPFTAVACTDRLGAALSRLAGRNVPEAHRYDEHGDLRVIAEPLPFAKIVDSAFDQIRQYGASSVLVSARLLEIIALILDCAPGAELREALLRQAEMIERGSHKGLAEERDRATITMRYQEVLRVRGAL
ncbi:MAG TPA: DUF2254 domain-containing protein [Roseiflexaceae bacterium]|nr:DUF2254 domain-containing protein [Roseiflexaceae bacterium]